MTARFSNTSRHAAVARASRAPGSRGRFAGSVRRALALLAASGLAGGLGGCGGGDSVSAQSLLRETFASHKPIESGRIELSVALSGEGSAGSPVARDLFSLHLQGPFQSVGRARLPRFALLVDLRSAELGPAGVRGGGQTLALGATFTAGRLFIELDGTQFVAPPTTVRALEQGYAQAARSPSPAGTSSTLAASASTPANGF